MERDSDESLKKLLLMLRELRSDDVRSDEFERKKIEKDPEEFCLESMQRLLRMPFDERVSVLLLTRPNENETDRCLT
jgi:hypothetical protein